jgi:hypothetical protein
MQSPSYRFSRGAAVREFAARKIDAIALYATEVSAANRIKCEMQRCIERWENEGGGIAARTPGPVIDGQFHGKYKS